MKTLIMLVCLVFSPLVAFGAPDIQSLQKELEECQQEVEYSRRNEGIEMRYRDETTISINAYEKVIKKHNLEKEYLEQRKIEEQRNQE